jgi:ketosteroid isomerase-like protein
VRSVAHVTLELDTPTAAYRAAAEAHDVDGMVACMAPDVALTSPITSRFTFEGREQLRHLLEDVFAVMDDVRYTDDAGDDRVRILRAEARVGGQRIVEAMVIRLDADGRIVELELFVRPMPGLTALAAALGPRVARRRSRTRALAVRAMIAPLALMTRSGEGIGTRLARP